ncbi:MAG: hypothetical protein M0C28_15290 [Candidatus Moduliflexus flocculans]|nr:hypothetical protein [Candidatus Moduliflexus flocculans]
MIIGARAVGASSGFLYIRNEYPLAIDRVGKALEQARAYGLLGTDILGTGFDFDLEVVRGAGAFVSGEETALLASIEGGRAYPRQRPPYPAQRGLWGQPTVINNVETWANIPSIIRRGAAWFAGLGTAGSKGTKVFSLVGKIANTGLVEVPMGISLAGDRLRHRRRHPRRPRVQGGPDRRPLGRLHPQGPARPARSITRA